MARRKQKKTEETLVNVVEAQERASDFFERNQNYILGAVATILVIIGGWFAYKTFILKPKQEEAIEQMSQAQLRFQQDSFALALQNPGAGFPGFLDIIDDYGITASGNTAKYYAGICYLNLGRFDDAIAYLNKYNAKDDLTKIMKYGTLGDAYAEIGDMTKALSFYKKATGVNENDFLVPYYLKKYAQLSEHQGDRDEALKAFKRIKTDFPNSSEGLEADKYIALYGE